MRHLKTCLLALPFVLLVTACSKDGGSPLTPGTPGATGPVLQSPSEDQQLDTLRPTLTVTNSTATGGSGARTYEFQVASDAAFATTVYSKTAVPEGTSTTSLAVDQDLPATSLLYWRARLTRGSATSDWSAARRFRTRAVGRNIPGELFDPLTDGTTLGTLSGSTTVIPGRGIQLNDKFAYIRYALPQPLVNGEISVEVEGLRPNGPGGKPKIFQMVENLGLPSSNNSLINAQYRGDGAPGGNPNNSIAFKAVLGNALNLNAIVEPDIAKRNNSILMPDPARTYFWQGIWTNTTFRLVVKDGGANGSVIYDYTMTAPAGAGFAGGAHYVFLGTNYEQFVTDTGTFPGLIVRNLWVSNKPRPASLAASAR